VAELSCELLTPEGALYSGAVDMVVAPAADGEVGILVNHAPLITALGVGTLSLKTKDGPARWRVAGGFLEVFNNQVSVLAEKAEPVS